MTSPATTQAAAWAETIPAIDEGAAQVAREQLDQKTKPRGSLGRLETLAWMIAGMRADPMPAALQPAVAVFAADHGVASAGVSAYPAEVTAQMLLNYAAGGAAINVLSQRAGARLLVADFGVLETPPTGQGIIDARIAAGTRDFRHDPAMSVEQATAAVEKGIAIAQALIDEGATLIATGEMGIGNTTAAAALCAHFTGREIDAVTGRGTGVDDEGLARKREAVRDALAQHAELESPLEALAALGGFEIAGLCGLILGAAQRRVPVLLDGFITGAAALAAAAIAPRSRDYMIASHQSEEPGHAHLLEHLGLRPLLQLGLRLGEGSGAALALPLVDAALAILRDMATFASAAVTDTGR